LQHVSGPRDRNGAENYTRSPSVRAAPGHKGRTQWVSQDDDRAACACAPVLDALQVLHPELFDGGRPLVPRLPSVVGGERGARAEAARPAAVSLASEVLHDRVQVGAFALGGR